MTWKPNRWIAALLGLILGPIGPLYAGAPRAAVLVFIGAICGALFLFCAGEGATSAYLAVFQWGLIALCAVVANRCAASASMAVRPWYTRWQGLIAVSVATFLLIGAVRTFLVEPFHIPSSAMEPTLPVGANIVAQKWGFGHFSTYGLNFGSHPHSTVLTRGDIAVFDYPVDPTQTYVKRIVGLPGDTIIYRGGHLLVNGIDTRLRALDDYVVEATMTSARRFREKLDGKEFDVLLARGRSPDYPQPLDFDFRTLCTFDASAVKCDVPKNHYFVLGDYRDNSLDSRRWGFVRADQVVGKVIAIFR